MNLKVILFCFTIASVAYAAGITKPRLNHHHDKATQSSQVQKLPEERRRLPMFPKHNKKFIVTPFVYRRYSTQTPIVTTKKPLMKKNVILNKGPDLIKVDRASNRPLISSKFMNVQPVNLFKKPGVKVHKRENTEVFIEPAELNYENNHNNFFDGDFSVQGDYTEDMATVIYPIDEESTNIYDEQNKKDVPKLEDFIFILKVKPTEATIKDSKFKIEDFIFAPKVKPTEAAPKIIQPNIKDCIGKDVKVSPEEVADVKEFIFLNVNKPEDIEPKITNEVDSTTGIILESKSRAKRGINVIEEENVGTTVSGYRFTERDSRLSSDLIFKNINT